MAVKSATFRKQFLQLVGEAYDKASKGNNLEKFVDGITAFCGRGSRAMRPQSQPVPASTDDGTTPWLADEAGIVEWIRKKNNGGKEIKIISGLEAIRISSPQDFLAETLNVHRPDDANAWLLLEEKLTRAVEAKSDFGWREFILCRENWQKIHPSWWSHWQYFAMAIVEIDGVRRVAKLRSNGRGCDVYFIPVGLKSNGYGRFPVLASPRS